MYSYYTVSGYHGLFIFVLSMHDSTISCGKVGAVVLRAMYKCSSYTCQLPLHKRFTYMLTHALLLYLGIIELALTRTCKKMLESNGTFMHWLNTVVIEIAVFDWVVIYPNCFYIYRTAIHPSTLLLTVAMSALCKH